ncbi:MAG: GIY-YIG nuclease family protein [Maricaulaceae bacterium]
MRPIWVYILRCSDGSYYTGSYRGEEIETRLSEHNLAVDPKAYTAKRRPVTLVWAETFINADDAIAFERQVKGWSRKKKEALIRNEWEALPVLSKRGKA